MFKKILSIFLVLIMVATLCGCAKTQGVGTLQNETTNVETESNDDYADTVVYGTIYTAENQEVVEAFAVKDGKYIYVGDKAGAEKYVKDGLTEIVDKSGDYLVAPGFTEGHGHFFGIDAVMKVLPGFYAQYDELLSIVDKKVKEEKIDKFFSYGLNVIEMMYANIEDRNYAEEIEKVAPGIPVVFVDNAAHQAVCNVTALKMAGLWDKQDLRGGEYLYDKSGRINGIIRDQALPYVIDKVIGTMLTEDEYRKACQIAIDNLHDRGFTNFFDAWLNFADDSSLYKYIKEFDDAGKLNLNVGACYNIRSYESEKYKEVVDHVLDIADKYHSKHFNPYYIKLFADGVVESQTGWLIDEYPLADEGHKHGNIIWTKEELKDVTKYANSKGILIHTHAYGDGACQAITEAYLKSNEELGKKYRNGLGHVRNILDEDKKKIGENGIAVAENLIWHCGDEMLESLKDLWPDGIADNGYPMKSLLDNGIRVSSSTDSPCGEVIPGNVMNIIEVATTGKFYDEPDIPAFNPSELLTIKEVLDCLTINGAWQLGLEEERGSIKVGKYADFSIMNKNILDYKDDKLLTIHEGKIIDIYFEGKNVYSNINEKAKVDKIIKNANVYTSDKKNLNATSFAIKDGKFVYVGNEAGLANYDGEVIDIGGKFIMPTFIDAHVHLPACLSALSLGSMENIVGNNKRECLEAMKKVVVEHAEYDFYTFLLQLIYLGDEDLTKEDLDTVCADKEVFVLEGEGHSSWSNSLLLKNMGITDDTSDMAEGLAFYVRDDNGHITGNAFEGPHTEIMMRNVDKIKDEDIISEFKRWIDFCKKAGVIAVFEAGTPGSSELTERGLQILCDMDRKGELPIYIDASYMVYNPAQGPTAMEELIRLNKKFNTEHVKVNTLKFLFDGTLNIRTANMITPYNDTETTGGRLFDENQVADFLKELNELGFNLHSHCVGEGSIKTILDGVEIAKKELGDDFKIKVTIAHNEIMRDEDIPRFKELGVIANFTPWWHSGACVSGGYKEAKEFLADRADKMYRSKSVWDTGAMVTWSSDTIQFGEFYDWNPMLGFEVGITREITPNTNVDHNKIAIYEKYPNISECMSIEEMILGYTINAATQLCIDNRKGSIEVGKDADYLIFDENLLERSPIGISNVEPKEVWFSGELVNKK